MYEIDIQDNSRADVYIVETNTSPVQAINGRTGNVTIGKNDVGLTNVDNTADIDKPISRAVSNALEERLARGFYLKKIKYILNYVYLY